MYAPPQQPLACRLHQVTEIRLTSSYASTAFQVPVLGSIPSALQHGNHLQAHRGGLTVHHHVRIHQEMFGPSGPDGISSSRL